MRCAKPTSTKLPCCGITLLRLRRSSPQILRVTETKCPAASKKRTVISQLAAKRCGAFGKQQPVTTTDLESHHFLLRNLLHRSEEHTSELQSLMRISYAVFCLKQKTNIYNKYKY